MSSKTRVRYSTPALHRGDTVLIGQGVKVGVVGDLLDAYEPVDAWDEMFDASGKPRIDYHALYEHVQTLSRADFDERCTTRDRVFRDQGITFALSGEERPFPLDLVPRVISASEWATIERGVAQRVRALERFLDDVYGEGEIMRGVVAPDRRCGGWAGGGRAVGGARGAAGWWWGGCVGLVGGVGGRRWVVWWWWVWLRCWGRVGGGAGCVGGAVGCGGHGGGCGVG